MSLYPVRTIQHEGDRVETGIVQIGDDWPGLFIRADEALGFYSLLGSEHANIREQAIKELREMFLSATTVTA